MDRYVTRLKLPDSSKVLKLNDGEKHKIVETVESEDLGEDNNNVAIDKGCNNLSARLSDCDTNNTTDTDSTSEPVPGPSNLTLNRIKKKKWYNQKFKEEWKTQFDFIEQRKGQTFCKVCNIKLNGGIFHIKRHKKSNYHQKQYNASKVTPKINSVLTTDPLKKMNTSVRRAELILTNFIIEHNLPFRLMDHLPLMCASAFPDSQIAKKIKMKRKKCTKLTVDVLGPSGKKSVVEVIRKHPFSIIVDESTDISQKKCLVIVVRFFNKMKVTDAFLDLIEISEATAQGIYTAIKNVLDTYQIPYNNVIGIGADNANVMLGQIHSVQTLCKQNFNEKICVMGCTCHSFHLCSSYACKKLPVYLEKFVHDICNYFSKSTKRNDDLTQFQTYVQEVPSKILKISKTRWLSLGTVVNRILKHWGSLNLYFQDEALSENVLNAGEIVQNFNKITKCYLLFLSYILEVVNKINLEFQSEYPKITVLLARITNLYILILKNFIKKTVIDRYRDKIQDLNFQDPSNFLDLDAMYFGAQFELFLLDNQDSIQAADLLAFKRRSLAYYIELCIQIKTRFNFKSEHLKFASNFEPDIFTSGKVLSVAQAKNLFGVDVDVEELNTEWHLAGEVGKNFLHLDLVSFWGTIKEQKNTLNEQMFPNLSKIIDIVLALPHSSAVAERIFSQVNLIKVKTRNQLLIPTVSAILSSKELLRNCNCYNFEPACDYITKDFGGPVLEDNNDVEDVEIVFDI